MRRLLVFRCHKYASACLFAGVLVVVANEASLSAQAGDPAPSAPATGGPTTLGAPAETQTPASPAAGTTTPKPASGPTSAKPDLKASVTLVGVTDYVANDALTIAAPLGQPLPLILVVKDPPAGHQSGELRTLPFTSGEQPPAIATARLRMGGSNTANEFATLGLDKPGQTPFFLEFDRLRP